MAARLAELHRIARLHGVQTAYRDVTGQRRSSTADTLLAALRSLRVPVETLGEVPEALRDQELSFWKRVLEPVCVAWDGNVGAIPIRLPRQPAARHASCELVLESGERSRHDIDLNRLPTVGEGIGVTAGYVELQLELPIKLPSGYHRLIFEMDEQCWEAQILAAPRRAYGETRQHGKPLCGCFLPIYAVRSDGDWGAGTYWNFERLVDQTREWGAQLAATLPFLATFLDDPCEPSPYSPISRMFWNEFFVDVTCLPEFATCDAARRMVNSSEIRDELEAVRKSPTIDYRRIMAIKRRVLECLCDHVHAQQGAEARELERFRLQQTDLAEYARFRATMERRRAPWPDWPATLRNGCITSNEYDQRIARYHEYAQWCAARQVDRLAAQADAAAGLYLDLPLGVHPHGFDTWRHRDDFALDAAVGAPPDAVFTRGQSWGFPPLHPQASRENGHRYFLRYLRRHMQLARMLRIDHVMGLHRLYWIPQGMDAASGVFVKYPADELYAILTLESHRYRTTVFGENLGTVPAVVNRTMTQHNVRRMHVVQYELRADASKVLPPAPKGSIASMNTHDMPPFAAYWNGDDIPFREQLGLLDAEGVCRERLDRETIRRRLVAFLQSEGFLPAAPDGMPQPGDVLRACLAYLSQSDADVLLVNLEDLWLENESQNVPGTGPELPNWRRRAQYSVEELKKFSQSDLLRNNIKYLRGKRPPAVSMEQEIAS